MAFKTVQLRSDIAVAALAEVLIAAHHAAVFAAGMALDAAIEAVVPGAYALVHCFIALMTEQFHVVFAHELGVFHAFFTLPGFDHRLGHTRSVRSTYQRRYCQHEEHK
ncbi:MAG: hypothetical protein Q8L40_03700 [Burkholderiales bacterium]|nr:hypothetical protein [Burkholderiales bacterium]